MKQFIIAFIFTTIFFKCFSQKAPAKFGAISKSDLEMITYEKDTSAVAVILCDYGYFQSNTFNYVHLIRIKILRKEGYSLANYVFPKTVLGHVRGITFNLENGEIVKEILDKKSVFTEHVALQFYNTRVAMPNVKVGSVIDIEFSYVGLPNSWNFQYKIPVKHSELIIERPSQYSFSKTFYGYEPLFLVDNNRWVAKDVPAFKSEPFMNSEENYITKMELDFSIFPLNWDIIQSELKKDSHFGVAIGLPIYLNEAANEILKKKLTNSQKIDSAFKIAKGIKWNESQSVVTSTTALNSVFKQKSGNSADINLILLQLLRKIGFEANPVVLSTRKNGMLSPITASRNRLNHVIVYLESEGKSYLLDATEEYSPYYLLPEKCLNGQGRLLKEEESLWVDLKTTRKEKEFSIYNLTMNNDLSLKGKINYIRYDYAALNFRKKYFSFNSMDEFLSDFVNSKPGMDIISSDIANISNYDIPVEDKYDVIISKQVIQIGNEYFLYPMLYEQLRENPFRAEERIYPVDYAYLRDKTVTVNIIIPENYEIVELPDAVKMNLPENNGSFLYQVNVINNQISASYKFLINNAVILPDQYPFLKEFYNQIISKHSQPIILKKK